MAKPCLGTGQWIRWEDCVSGFAINEPASDQLARTGVPESLWLPSKSCRDPLSHFLGSQATAYIPRRFLLAHSLEHSEFESL